MKRKILLLLLLILFIFPLSSCYRAPEHDIIVYVTSAGQKYHKAKCRYVRGKAIEISLSKALYEGYSPCKVCRPPTQKDLDKINEKQK